MVVDERTLAIPDRPGNSILMGLQNVLANPNAGICFEIPGYGTTLRVGGKAELSNDPELLHLLEARGAKNALLLRHFRGRKDCKRMAFCAARLTR